MGSANGLLLAQVNLATATADYPICQHQRPTPRAWRDQPPTWWQADYTGPLPPWKGQYFILTRIDTYSGYGFAFPACNTSGKTTIHGLIECPPNMEFHTVLLLIMEFASQQKKCCNRPMIMKFAGLVVFPSILKQLAFRMVF